MHMGMSQESFCAEICRENAVSVSRGKHFVRACAVEMHKMHMDRSQEAFCAEIYRENAKRDRYHLDWTPGLNTYRKNPSGWPQCLGNRHKRIFMTGLTSSGYLDGWTGFILLQCFYNGNMSPACHTSLICKKYTHKWVKQETSGSRHQLARKLNRYYHWFVCMLGYGDAASNAVKTLALNPEAGPGPQVIHQIHHHAGQLWVFDSHQTLVCVVRKVPTSWGTHAHSTTGRMIVWPRTPEKN